MSSQYIPDMTERFPEGMDGIDLTDSYFPPTHFEPIDIDFFAELEEMNTSEKGKTDV